MLTIEELAQRPFPCPNCSVTFDDVRRAFCSDLCTDEAALVRYVRRCKADGHDEDPKVKEAITIKLAHILNGGYNEAARRLPKSVRRLVIERDGGRCQTCGEPGTEIDHINGSSSALTNLQLLCDTCHNKKTVAGFKRITDPKKLAKAQELRTRAEAPEPLLLCDDYKHWDNLWKELRRKRREAATGQGGLFE
jgi:hypothetical protein